MKAKTAIQIIIITLTIVLVTITITSNLTTYYSDKYIQAIINQTPFTEGGQTHPWYIAPMKGYTVQLQNGSIYTVHSDYWDSCEHNPNQGHLIGIGYTNKTAYDERTLLDQDIATRNYTATFQTIAWVNASLVKQAIFQAW